MSARVLEGPKTAFPIREKSLGHFLFNRCTKWSERVCQIDGTSNQSETYGSVKLRTTRLAIEFQRKNVAPEDVIVVCSENTLDNMIPIIAGLYVGAIIANLDPSLSVRHTKHLLALVKPKMVFVDEASVKLIEDSLESEVKTEMVVFGSSTKYSTFKNLIKKQKQEEKFVPVDVHLDSLALMFFSSGTTGLPKAICHSHRNYFSVVDQTSYAGWDEDVFHFTTFYWNTAMMILLGCFNRGSYRIFCRNITSEEIFKIIETYKIKSMFMAPVLTFKLTQFENSARYDTSSVKTMSMAGTPMTVPQIKKVKSLFPKAHTTLLYGMTEIGIATVFHPLDDKDNIKISSCGKPGPDVKLKVVDDNGKILPPNQKGEICVWSPSLMKGYYKLDSSEIFDHEGFLKTGDIGYYDEDDCLYVIERIKEMFRYQSWHIIPSFLEAVLVEHPAINEAVVFGIPDEVDDEVPAACVVLKNGTTLKEQEIDNFLRERVADRERLRAGVTFVDSLPKTPTGKVIRSKVREFVISLKK